MTRSNDRHRDSSRSRRTRSRDSGDAGYSRENRSTERSSGYNRYTRSGTNYHAHGRETGYSASRAGANRSSSHRSYERADFADDAQRHHSSERGNRGSAEERYSSRDSRVQYLARSKRKRRRKHIVMGVLIGVLVLVLGVGGYAFGLINKINSSLHAGLDDTLSGVLVKSNINNEPFYVLLMGTDASSDREGDEYFGGVFRTDTIILARVDPTAKKVTLISIPRDTQVDMGQYGTQKINAAHAYGGATLAVQCVENLTGVQISHYVEVNFDGFSSIVDALGGIDVDVPTAINDADAGGCLAAGEQTLDGEQALILCRSRNTYEDTGAGDLYRSANQRLVLGAIANKLLDSDIVTITNTVTAMAEYVTTDLTANEIVSLAQNFKGFDSSTDLYTAEFPTESSYENGVWYEKAKTSTWKTMLARMQQGLPPVETTEVDSSNGTVLASAGDGSTDSSTSTTHTGTVYVRNGTSTSGLAASAATKIAAMGFTTETGNADASTYTSTVVIYDDSSYASEAQAIVDVLGCGSAMQNDGSYINNGKFLVVVGADYTA